MNLPLSPFAIYQNDDVAETLITRQNLARKNQKSEEDESVNVPFLGCGKVITAGPHFPLTSDALNKILAGQASREGLLSVAHALLGWLVASPFIFGTLYVVLLPCFKILLSKFSNPPLSETEPLQSHSEAVFK
ncbi:hypothetical protein Lal_00024335, partial [Lupinus albus]